MTMLNFVRVFKFTTILAVAAAILVGAPTHSYAKTGKVRLNIVKAGFIIGGGGGSGILAFGGKTYRLRVGGLGIGSLGVSDVQLAGTASNLRTASDIAGTYAAAGAGIAVVGGGQVATLQNEKGVVLNLQGVQYGFQVSLGLGGMTIALQ
jgi:hypothetical protein